MTNEHDVPADPAGVPPVSPQVLEQRYGSTPGFYVGPPRQRFQHRYGRHIVLFLLTLLTTYYAPLGGGFWYALPILIILSAHEFGHYIACRIHKVDATLPYFIPAPPM
ncbi:MAG TPA: hypothetical protein VFO19_02665, partial [Vicinamibacterales bacterium]|nr:hypothetical protein [Vicinamibacterales bacterium]